jgi:hypothetical protein
MVDGRWWMDHPEMLGASVYSGIPKLICLGFNDLLPNLHFGGEPEFPGRQSTIHHVPSTI